MTTTYVWLGKTSSHTGDWNTGSNWNLDGVPGVGDIAQINEGVATDDADAAITDDEVGSLSIGAGAGLVIGDSGNLHHAIVTLDGNSASVLLGSVTIHGDSSAQSTLQATGTIVTSNSTTAGTIDIDGGTLLDAKSLDITGNGRIEMDGGYIGGSSVSPSATLTSSVTIAGVGDIDAVNYYSGTPEFNELITNNLGVIDATNPAAGYNWLTISGGIVNNYGALEATNSVPGSSGDAVLDIDFGAVINNKDNGYIGSGVGAAIEMQGGVINNGAISGTLGVFGGGNTIESTGTTDPLTNNGRMNIAGDVGFASTGSGGIENNGQIYIYSGGQIDLAGKLNNNLNATIEAYAGGSFTTSSSNAVTNTGQLIADGGALTFNDLLISSGKAIIENDGVLTLNNHASGGVSFQGPGELDFGQHDIGGNGVLGGAVSGFSTGDSMTFENVNFATLGTDVSYVQKSGLQGILQIGAFNLLMDGNYAPIGILEKGGALPFSLESGMDLAGHSLPGTTVTF